VDRYFAAVQEEGLTGKDGLLYGMASRGSGLIGLDICTTSVKAARIRRRGDHVTVTGIARAAIEAAGPINQSADDRIVTAIWRCLRSLRGRTGVACGVAGPEVAIRAFEFTALPRHQLASAVELEAAQVCPFEVSEAAVSYHVLGGPPAKGAKPPANAQRIRGFFAAANNKIIQHRRTLCERGETTCAVMDVDGLALLNRLEGLQGRGAGEAAISSTSTRHTNGDRLKMVCRSCGTSTSRPIIF
jgi:Tfp pilus assembly PilM family ATPase